MRMPLRLVLSKSFSEKKVNVEGHVGVPGNKGNMQKISKEQRNMAKLKKGQRALRLVQESGNEFP